MTELDREITSVHELGHAVFALKHNLRVVSVEVWDNDVSGECILDRLPNIWGLFHFKDPMAVLAGFILAGPMVQRIVYPDSKLTPYDLRALDKYSPKTIAAAKEKVKKLFGDPAVIEKIKKAAVVLARKGFMTGEEVKEAMK